MIEINNNEMIEVTGGLSLTGTVLNALARGVTAVYDLGRAFGSAIRRLYFGGMCSI